MKQKFFLYTFDKVYIVETEWGSVMSIKALGETLKRYINVTISDLLAMVEKKETVKLISYLYPELTGFPKLLTCSIQCIAEV